MLREFKVDELLLIVNRNLNQEVICNTDYWLFDWIWDEILYKKKKKKILKNETLLLEERKKF